MAKILVFKSPMKFFPYFLISKIVNVITMVDKVWKKTTNCEVTWTNMLIIVSMTCKFSHKNQYLKK